jgi:nucleoside-triphosphatase
MKNIFLTGPRQVGKSTAIRKALANFNNLDLRGFKTLPVFEKEVLTGFILESLNPADTYPQPYVGRQKANGFWQAVPQTFEEFGVKILKEALAAKPDLILMDELGFFESEALNFQKQVLKCLASPIPVLGVIKPLSTPFLKAVRSSPGVLILEINKENREDKYQELVKHLEEVLS